MINWFNWGMTLNVNFSLHAHGYFLRPYCFHASAMQAMWTCGPKKCKLVRVWTCGLVDLWTCGLCGPVDSVHLWALWTCGLHGPVDLWTCGPVDSVKLWTLWTCGPVDSVNLWTCGLADSVDLCTLWTCGPYGPVDSVDLCTWGNGLTHGLNCCLVSYFAWFIAFWNYFFNFSIWK